MTIAQSAERWLPEQSIGARGLGALLLAATAMLYLVLRRVPTRLMTGGAR